jgi:hypothetical protein
MLPLTEAPQGLDLLREGVPPPISTDFGADFQQLITQSLSAIISGSTS